MGCLGPTTAIKGLLLLAHQDCPQALIFIGSSDDKKKCATWCHDPFPQWFLLPPWLPSCIQGASRWTHLLNHYGSKLSLAHPAEKQEALQHFQRESFYSKCWHSCLKWKFSLIFESLRICILQEGKLPMNSSLTGKDSLQKIKILIPHCKTLILDQK